MKAGNLWAQQEGAHAGVARAPSCYVRAGQLCTQ